MKLSILKPILFLFTTLLYVGCTTSVDILQCINTKEPITLTDHHRNIIDGKSYLESFEIQAEDEKYKRFITWASENQFGWQSLAPASYMMDVTIVQQDFSLSFNLQGDFVMVRYKDQLGKNLGYQKSIIDGELDFLVEK